MTDDAGDSSSSDDVSTATTTTVTVFQPHEDSSEPESRQGDSWNPERSFDSFDDKEPASTTMATTTTSSNAYDADLNDDTRTTNMFTVATDASTTSAAQLPTIEDDFSKDFRQGYASDSQASPRATEAPSTTSAADEQQPSLSADTQEETLEDLIGGHETQHESSAAAAWDRLSDATTTAAQPSTTTTAAEMWKAGSGGISAEDAFDSVPEQSDATTTAAKRVDEVAAMAAMLRADRAALLQEKKTGMKHEGLISVKLHRRK